MKRKTSNISVTWKWICYLSYRAAFVSWTKIPSANKLIIVPIEISWTKKYPSKVKYITKRLYHCRILPTIIDLLINKKFLYCMGLFSDHCMTYKVAGPCCCVRGQDFKIQYFLAKRHLLYLFLLVNFVLYFQMVSPRKRIQSLNNSLSYLS